MFRGNDRDWLCWSPRPFGYCGCSAQEVTADTAEAPLKGWGGVIAVCTLCALDGEGRARPGVLAGQFLPQGDSGLFDATMENDARPTAECLPQQCGAGEPL